MARNKKYWTYRGYDSPLTYFFVHWEEFCLFTRTELAGVDFGLYRSLLRWGQMGEAIPESFEGQGAGRPPLSQEEDQEILDCYRLCDGNVTEIVRKTGYCFQTIIKRLKSAGLKAKGKPGKPRKAV